MPHDIADFHLPRPTSPPGRPMWLLVSTRTHRCVTDHLCPRRHVDGAANTTAIADYKVAVTTALTNVTTVSTRTAPRRASRCTRNYRAELGQRHRLRCDGVPSQTSTSNAPLYVAALTGLSWNPSAPAAVVGQAMSVQFSAAGSTSRSCPGPTGQRLALRLVC